MRISKPSTTGETSYEIYQNIALRDQASEKMEDGQEVKVLDASGDPNIKKGWAIYKFSKKSNLFDLLEKQEQPVIPAPTIINTDEFTIFKTTNDKLVVPEAMIGSRVEIRILEDFDFSMKYDGKDILLKPIGGTRSIPIMYGERKRFLTICNYELSCEQFNNKGKGKRVNWVIVANVSDTNETITTQITKFTRSGKPVDVKPNSNDIQLQIMQVSVLVPPNGSAPRPESFIIHKYWKKALAPAEERIKPEAVKIDNYTIEKNGDILTVPASLNPIRHNYTIRKNFQLDLNFDDKNFIRVTPRGANAKGFLEIPIEISSTGELYKLQLGTVDLPVSAFAGSPEVAHFGIMANISEVKTACTYIVEADGSPIKLQPKQTDQKICIAQVRAKLPVNTDGWKEEFVTMWRYWETALLETFGETFVDGYGAEHIENNGLKQITSMGAMTPNYYNLRYFQDFDFDFKVIYDKTNNSFNVSAQPIGGARTIKATRAITDANGIVQGKETLYPSINMIDGTFNDPEKGKYYYFHFGSNMPSADTLQLMTTTISLIPTIRPQSNYMVTYGVIKIYIPKDGEQFDYGKVYLYRYWRNALASFDELMQDYKKRNP